MKKKGIDSNLVRKIKGIYEKMYKMIKTKEVTEKFKMKKRIKQNCVMSPALFNLYGLCRFRCGTDQERNRRNYSGERKSLIFGLRKRHGIISKKQRSIIGYNEYIKEIFKGKEIRVYTDKTKVIVFNNKKKEERRNGQKYWGTKEIEKVKTFKYLGFMFNVSGNYRDHVKKLNRKSRKATCKDWRLGERRYKNDFRRRWFLYKYLVHGVINYGVEIQRWEEKKELEKIMLDYVR